MLAPLILAALIAQPAAFAIDPAHAEAGFDLKATMHTVHGSTTSVTGHVRAEPGDAGALKLSGKIEIGAASLETGNEKRDQTMRRSSLLVSTFPTIALEPERFAPSGPALPDGSISGAITGRLTIRGQTKDVSIAATLAPRGERIAAAGTFDVTWAEFGVPDPSFFVVRIERVAHAHFRAEFVPAP